MNDLDLLKRDLLSEAKRCTELFNSQVFTNHQILTQSAIGKCPNAVKIGEDISLGNEYQDDIAFYYGDKRIYLVRHIKRLLEELPNKINKLK